MTSTRLPTTWARALRGAPLLGLMALLTALPSQAQYKVVGPDGKITYTDRPPVSESAKVTALGRRGAAASGPLGHGSSQPGELLPAVGIVGELVERGAGRGEQDRVTGVGEGERPFDRDRKRPAHFKRHRVGEGCSDLLGGAADQVG